MNRVCAKPNRRPNVTCDRCATPMYRRRSTLAVNAGKYCSRACRNAVHTVTGRKRRPEEYAHLHGSTNPAWKGGVTYRRRRGNYESVRYVRCPADLRVMARADGYVMEHRLVMARWCGRPLTRVECVHHVDHAPLNNPRSNLELWPCNRSHKMAEHGRILEGAANAWRAV